MGYTIYTSVTIAGENPIEGSVSLSVDEGSNEVTKLKYEGGGVAAKKVIVDAKPTLTLEWKTQGKLTGGAVTTSGVSKTITTDLGQSVSVTGIYIKSPSWDSQWGFVTQHKLIQTPTANSSSGGSSTPTAITAPSIMVMSGSNYLIIGVEGYSESSYDYYFTTDGTDPTSSSTRTKYSSGQTITTSCTIKAVTVRKSDNRTSTVTSVSYTA